MILQIVDFGTALPYGQVDAYVNKTNTMAAMSISPSIYTNKLEINKGIALSVLQSGVSPTSLKYLQFFDCKILGTLRAKQLSHCVG